MKLIVLHPRHKLSYFRKAGWEEKWIEDAEKLVRRVFKKRYDSIAIAPTPAVTVCVYFDLGPRNCSCDASPEKGDIEKQERQHVR